MSPGDDPGDAESCPGHQASTADTGLTWTAWMPLTAAHPLALRQLPAGPGFFAIRQERAKFVLHVGFAEDGVRLVAERLARQSRLRSSPGSRDELAQRLWRLHRDEGMDFQIRGAEGSSGEDPAGDLLVLRAELDSANGTL